MTGILVRSIVPITEMFGDDEQDSQLLRSMAESARIYLRSFNWCKGIREEYFGDGYGGIVGVFLFLIEPSRPGIDEWLWVIIGDLPPAYLVTDSSKTPSQALESYIEEMTKWVQLAQHGKSSTTVIPVNMSATTENAEKLHIRLSLLSEVIVPAFREAEAVRS